MEHNGDGGEEKKRCKAGKKSSKKKKCKMQKREREGAC